MTSPVEIGAVIAGKYRVERVLGQGGMGVVVVAMHDELDQRVAIKFLLPEALSDSDWVTRFAREAKAAARIKSEHAVKVYDVGKLTTGAPYMVMEYLEGRDLQSILNDRRRLPVGEAVEYLLQACEAIAEAHSVGIIHRDLKPANLFVTHRTDGSPCVKILDFGISKMTSLTGGDNQSVTNTRAIVGSPLYMSPEQMRASKNVDKRTDIWSLGIMLQELTSGLPSFVANTTAELCAIVLTAPPTPLRETLPDAPPGLDSVIVRCLAKPPDERYPNIAELARALERFGPKHVHISVERIVRLGAAPNMRAELTSIDREDKSAPQLSPKTAESSGPISIRGPGATAMPFSQTEVSEAPSPSPSAIPIEPTASEPRGTPPVGAHTAAAWGSTRSPAGRARMPLIVGAVVGVVVLVVIGAVVTRGTSGSASGTSTVVSDHPPTTTTVTTTSTGAAASATTSATAVTTSVPSSAQGAMVATPMALLQASSKPALVATGRPSASASAHKPPTVDTAGFGGRN